MKKDLFINTLSFSFPKEAVTCFFSSADDWQKQSELIRHESGDLTNCDN